MIFITKKTLPYQQIFWAFFLTIILFLGINLTLVNTARADTNNLPNSVAKAVLQDASKRSRLPLKQLRIVESVKRDWADGCLEITQPGTICTQQVVPGWQVKVVGGRQSLIYRTNNSGSVVKLGSI
jgi:hypothetical protein